MKATEACTSRTTMTATATGTDQNGLCLSNPGLEDIPQENCLLAAGMAYLGRSSTTAGGVTSKAWRSLTQNLPRRWINDRVEVIYFPQAMHTKLRVDDKAYGFFTHTDRQHMTRMSSLNRQAIRNGKASEALSAGPQIRFQLRVSEQEMQELRQFIEAEKFGRFHCAASVCHALTLNTNMSIPVPARLSPALNAVYLAAARVVPGSRVTGIRILRPSDNRATGPAMYFEVGVGAYALLIGTVVGVDFDSRSLPASRVLNTEPVDTPLPTPTPPYRNSSGRL
jgi:hypothetical protein